MISESGRKQTQAFQEALAKTAHAQGIDLFGAADLTPAQEYISKQGGDYLKNFPRGISIGMRLLDPVVSMLCQHEDPAVLFTYRSHYNAVNAHLDDVALLLSKKIQTEGFNAYPIPASQMINTERIIGVISHKLVANLAGLGWIGKNCVLITPQHGPRVRFATILTDAPLKVGAEIPNRCGACKKCVQICPVKAILGVQFDPQQPQEARFKAPLCKEYTDRRKERVGEGLCGLCIYICPYGTKAH